MILSASSTLLSAGAAAEGTRERNRNDSTRRLKDHGSSSHGLSFDAALFSLAGNLPRQQT